MTELSFPYAGNVYAEGLSASQIRENLTNKLIFLMSLKWMSL